MARSNAARIRGFFKGGLRVRVDKNLDISFVQMLYFTLRKCRPDFKPEKYRWRLGTAVVQDLDAIYNYGIATQMLVKPDAKLTLYGINVEIDYENPYNLQLFEDITNKIPENTSRL